MNGYDAQNMARDLMREHDLKTWRFQWMRGKKIQGRCNYTDSLIELSENYVRINDPASVRQTILHEIAHALVGHGHGHDRIWQLTAMRIGATGRRQDCDSNAVPGKWRLVCTVCDVVMRKNVHKRMRADKLARRYHPACGRHTVKDYTDGPLAYVRN